MGIIAPEDNWEPKKRGAFIFDQPAQQAPTIETQPAPIQPPRPQQSFSQPYFTCKVCDRGSMETKTMFRMSTPVVAIGFILLVPSIIGIIVSLFIFFGFMTAGSTVNTSTMKSHGLSASRTQDATQNMTDLGVPPEIISNVLHGENDKVKAWLNKDPDTYGRVTAYQEETIRNVQAEVQQAGGSTQGAGNAGINLLSVVAGTFSLGTAIACFVGGLLGWLLLMRKRVLQCTFCQAVVNAS